MEVNAGNLINILLIMGIFILSVLPLHRAIKIMKGKTSFPKTLFIVLIAGTIISFVNSLFSILGSIVAFILLIWIYHKSFRLKWWKAFMVWFLHLVFVAVGGIILSIIFGFAFRI